MAARAMEFLPRSARRWMRRNERSAWKGLVAGAAGGLVGTIVMSQFQNAWQKASEKGRSGSLLKAKEENSRQRGPEQQAVPDQPDQKKDEQKEDATMKTAGKLARAAGHELTREERRKASPFVHYGFGMAMGALYGMAMETSPRGVRAQRVPFFGSIFGSALFLGADEMAVPALGLAEAAEEPSAHLYGWASHLVYGVTAEFVRRQVRKRI